MSIYINFENIKTILINELMHFNYTKHTNKLCTAHYPLNTASTAEKHWLFKNWVFQAV